MKRVLLQRFPPGPVERRKDFFEGGCEVVLVQQTLEPILGHRALLEQVLPMGHQRAQLADAPRGGTQTAGIRLAESLLARASVSRLSVFDPEAAMSLSLCRVGDYDPADQGNQLIVERPGIDGGFQHYLISGQEMLCRPRCKLRQTHPARREHHGWCPIDSPKDDVGFVNI
jgi:hypothetical protein